MYPPQSNLLPAGEQASRILFSNLFALLSSDIYTHFCLVGRYLHRVRRSKIFFQSQMLLQRASGRVLPNRWGAQDEEGSNSDCKVGAHPRVPVVVIFPLKGVGQYKSSGTRGPCKIMLIQCPPNPSFVLNAICSTLCFCNPTFCANKEERIWSIAVIDEVFN